MTKDEVVEVLKKMGTESIKKVLMNHGAREPFFGVRVGDMKTLLKKLKGNQRVAMELYDTGISDAMYLAGLVADGSKMSKAEIQSWADGAYWEMLSEYTVPWVATESPFAVELAEEWILSKEEGKASSGWRVWADFVSVTPDDRLPLERLKELLYHVEKHIHREQNRVRYCMNNFVISVGAYVNPLSDEAIAISKKIGKVNVDMGGTACKVPFGPEYIAKSIARGSLSKKRKSIKC